MEDALFERLMLEVLCSMVAVHERPRSLCAISVQVLVNDGSTLACALCAMAMALLDAGIPLNGTFSALQAGLHQADWILDPTAAEEKVCSLSFPTRGAGVQTKHTHTPANSHAHNAPALPDAAQTCTALVTAAFVQRQGHPERQLLFCNHRGALELEQVVFSAPAHLLRDARSDLCSAAALPRGQLDYALQAVANGALATATFMRQSMEKRLFYGFHMCAETPAL